MDSRTTMFALYALGAGAVTTSLLKLKTRLALSKAKHRSLWGHSRLSRRIASLIPFYDYDEARFFRCDNPPEEVAARREAAFARLSGLFRSRYAETARLTAEIKNGISDLQFTDAYRVPFQFSRMVRKHLQAGALVQSS